MKKHLLNKVSAAVMLLCIICLSAVIPAVQVSALKSTGNINVQIAPFAEGVELSLYEIGTCKSGFKLNYTFRELDLDIANLKDAFEMKEAADTIADYAYDFDIDPVAKARVDSTGVAKFMNVDADFKLYAITQTSDKNTISIASFIVRMPYYTRIGGEYLYNLKVQAKYIDTRNREKVGAAVVDKICPKGYPLKNAMFTFEQKMYYTNEKMIPEDAELGEDRSGTYYWKILSRNMTTNDNGQIVVEDLPFGIYRFTEFRAPTGFILDSTPYIVHIDSFGNVTADEEGKYTANEGEPVILTVVNEPKETSNPNSSSPCQPSNPCQQSSDPCPPSSNPCESTPSNPGTPSDVSDSEVTHPESSYPDNSEPDISYPDVSYPDDSEPDISYPDVSEPDISYPDVSYPDVSYPDVSYPDISYPDVSYPDVSYPDISYPNVSYPDVSYPQIVPGNKGNSIYTGDEVGRYILISSIVAVSFASAFVMIFISRNKNKHLSN